MMRFNSIFVKLLFLTLSVLLLFSIVLYSTFSNSAEKLLQDQVQSVTLANLNFTKEKLENYSTEISETMLKASASVAFKEYITKEVTSSLDYINLVINLTDYLNVYQAYLTQTNAHIVVSSLPHSGGRYYTSNAIKWDRLPENIVSDYMTVDGMITNRILYHSGNDIFSTTAPYTNSVFATKPLIDLETKKTYGYVAIVIDERNLYEKYSGYITKGTTISLINANGIVLSSSDMTSIATKDKNLLERAIQTSQEPKGILTDQKISFFSIYLPSLDAYLLQSIDHKVAFKALHDTQYSTIKFMIIILFIMSIFIFIISRQITNPLYKIIRAMQASSGGKFNALPTIKNKSVEMKTLTETYNKLIHELDDHIERLLHEQKQCLRADLIALQMQINPHFLYNTLSSIKYLAKTGRVHQVEQTIQSLILMLKSTINSTDETIPLESELNLLKHYTYINQIRFGDQISVELDVSEDCLLCHVPKLVIQPFVENAFFHAFTNKPKGTISIFIRKTDHLLIEIIDNGDGIATKSKSKLLKKRHFNGIGIHNVDERIKMMYGPQYGITVVSEPHFGTDIKINLPIIFKDDDANTV